MPIFLLGSLTRFLLELLSIQSSQGLEPESYSRNSLSRSLRMVAVLLLDTDTFSLAVNESVTQQNFVNANKPLIRSLTSAIIIFGIIGKLRFSVSIGPNVQIRTHTVMLHRRDVYIYLSIPRIHCLCICACQGFPRSNLMTSGWD